MSNKLKNLILGILTISLWGCGAAVTPVPFVEPAPVPLTIYTTPAIVMSNSEIRVTCKLPRDVGEGEYVFGIVDMFKSMGPIDKLQYSRELVAPCEPFRIYCAYAEHKADGGLDKPVSITQDITPVGECR